MISQVKIKQQFIACKTNKNINIMHDMGLAAISRLPCNKVDIFVSMANYPQHLGCYVTAE